MLKTARRVLLFAILVHLPGMTSAVEPVRKDAFGDALPPGALARLGSKSFDPYQPDDILDLAPDGMTYVHASGADLTVRDTRTGRVIREWRMEEPGDNADKALPYTWVSFSADGRYLHCLRGSILYTLEPVSGKEGRSPSLEIDGIQGSRLVLSRDGKRLAGAGSEPLGDKVVVVDTTTGKNLLLVRLPKGDGWSMTFSEDRRMLALWGAPAPGSDAPSGRSHRLWDLEAGRELPPPPAEVDRINEEIFSPDGRHLAARVESRILIWNLQSGKIIKRFLVGEGASRMHYSPDGRQLLIGSSAGITRIWNLSTDERRFCRGPALPPDACRFLPDGRILTLGTDRKAVGVWDIVNGNLLTPQQRHTGAIEELVFTENDRTLLSVAPDGLRSWDLTGLRQGRPDLGWSSRWQVVLPRSEHSKPRFFELHAVPLRDGTLLQRRNGFVELTEPRTGRLLRSYPSRGPTMIAHPEGKTLFTQHVGNFRNEDEAERMLVWDMASGRLLLNLPTPVADSGDVAVSADGRVLAMVANRQAREPGFHRGVLIPARFDELFPVDGSPMSQPTELTFWQVQTGKESARISLEQEVFSALALSPDGQLAATARRDAVELREVHLNHPLPILETRNFWCEDEGGRMAPYMPRFGKLCFSPDGRLLAGTNYFSGPMIVWEVASGRIRHWQSEVVSMAFSSDSRLLATGDRNGSILVWDYSHRPALEGPHPKDYPPERLDQLWRELRSSDAADAFRAMTALQHRPDQAVALFAERVQPIVATGLDDKEITRLIQALDDDDFAVRENASAALTREPRSRWALLRTLEERLSIEKKLRIEKVLKNIKLEFPSPDLLRAVRAVEVLERLGTPAARNLLKTLASGREEERLTSEARAALQRLTP
jgi:WD40 repeat protein